MDYVTASTRYGRLRGFVEEGIEKYLGIPYAAPPIGALRWMPPRPCAAWQGLRDAFTFGNSCAQWHELGGFSKRSVEEDCLYLNVYAPRAHAPNNVDSRTARLPVMVWIPGGGFFSGSADEYDPTFLVNEGVIVVSINYRVGILGFFSHPAINSEGHANGNYGLMDQQAAFRWVRANIEHFGGDPDNITIFGESAGAVSVSLHMASPAAAGLFAKAIMQSSLGVFESPTLKSMEPIGLQFAVEAGCTSQEASCLRALPVEAILATNGPNHDLPFGVFVPRFGRFNAPPMIDGEILISSVQDTFSRNDIHQVPFISGTNTHEMTFFLALLELETNSVLTEQNYNLALSNHFGDLAGEIAKRYPIRNHESPTNALSAALSDSGFICPVRKSLAFVAAANKNAYAYSFNVPDAPSYLPQISFPFLSYHTGELPFIFRNFHGASGKIAALTEAQMGLSRQMTGYWTTFAATGSPNRPSSMRPEWPRYEPSKDNYMILETPKPRVQERFGSHHHCSFWDGVSARGLG